MAHHSDLKIPTCFPLRLIARESRVSYAYRGERTHALDVEGPFACAHHSDPYRVRVFSLAS